MASLLAPRAQEPRISQLLPTVKCSDCNQPVPLTELGEHKCEAPPPLPTPSKSPTVASFLPQRLQNLVSTSPKPMSPPPRQPPPKASLPATPSSPPQQQRRGTLLSGRPRQSSISSTASSAYSPPTKSIPIPTRPDNDRRDTVSSISSRFTSRTASSPRGPQSIISDARARTASITSSRSGMSSSSGGTARPSFLSGRDSRPTPPLDLRSASGPLKTPPDEQRRPSFGSAREPSSPLSIHPPTSPSRAPNSPPLDNARPAPSAYFPATASPNVGRGGALPPMGTPPTLEHTRGASYMSQRPSMEQRPSIDRRPSADEPRDMPPPASNISTEIGGEAGMAGVGRRGFAAAARVALLVMPPGGAPQQPPMDGRLGGYRANAPTYLDIGSNNYSNGGTPPLSPASGYSSPSALASPISPIAKTRSPSPMQPPAALNDPAMSSNPSSPSLSSMKLPFFEKFRNNAPPNDISQPNSILNLDNDARERRMSSRRSRSASVSSKRMTRASMSGSEVGLAYADSDEEDDAPPVPQLPDSVKHERRSRIQRRGDDITPRGSRQPDAESDVSAYSDDEGLLSRPRGNSKASDDALTNPFGGPSEPGSPPQHTTRLAGRTSTGTRSTYSRKTSMTADSPLIRAGLLERLMEDVSTEEPMAKPSLTKSKSERVSSTHGSPYAPTRSNTVPYSPEARPPKLPSRTRTNGSSSEKRPKKPKVCMKCTEAISNGRYIQVEDNILCERCWKHMYLPKCRRCNLPIEKQAVRSREGKLKGLYHRECFGCAVCHKPFTDKEFYVYDEKPLCGYHYHEANGSLCRACGEGIEGPCAVPFPGAKYHKDCFTCGHPGCNTILVEFWEVNSKFMCERHVPAQRLSGGYDDDWEAPPMSTKRVTRFIDLGGIPGLPGTDDGADSGLR
ncbi:hypothetical protein GGG16DRAFT_88959 [Schizophyllum commune]